MFFPSRRLPPYRFPFVAFQLYCLCSLFFLFFFALQQKCVKARALYDNIAEAPDELAFRKGDVLTVLEQNTAGLEGWWLCALRGRQVLILNDVNFTSMDFPQTELLEARDPYEITSYDIE